MMIKSILTIPILITLAFSPPQCAAQTSKLDWIKEKVKVHTTLNQSMSWIPVGNKILVGSAYQFALLDDSGAEPEYSKMDGPTPRHLETFGFVRFGKEIYAVLRGSFKDGEGIGLMLVLKDGVLVQDPRPKFILPFSPDSRRYSQNNWTYFKGLLNPESAHLVLVEMLEDKPTTCINGKSLGARILSIDESMSVTWKQEVCFAGKGIKEVLDARQTASGAVVMITDQDAKPPYTDDDWMVNNYLKDVDSSLKQHRLVGHVVTKDSLWQFEIPHRKLISDIKIVTDGSGETTVIALVVSSKTNPLPDQLWVKEDVLQINGVSTESFYPLDLEAFDSALNSARTNYAKKGENVQASAKFLTTGYFASHDLIGIVHQACKARKNKVKHVKSRASMMFYRLDSTGLHRTDQLHIEHMIKPGVSNLYNASVGVVSNLYNASIEGHNSISSTSPLIHLNVNRGLLMGEFIVIRLNSFGEVEWNTIDSEGEWYQTGHFHCGPYVYGIFGHSGNNNGPYTGEVRYFKWE